MIRRYKAKYQSDVVGGASIIDNGDGISVITIIGINKRYRRLGLGRKLIKNVIEKELKRNNIIRLECRPNSGIKDRVKEWYKRLGFVFTGEGNWMELRK